MEGEGVANARSTLALLTVHIYNVKQHIDAEKFAPLLVINQDGTP